MARSKLKPVEAYRCRLCKELLIGPRSYAESHAMHIKDTPLPIGIVFKDDVNYYVVKDKGTVAKTQEKEFLTHGIIQSCVVFPRDFEGDWNFLVMQLNSKQVRKGLKDTSNRRIISYLKKHSTEEDNGRYDRIYFDLLGKKEFKAFQDVYATLPSGLHLPEKLKRKTKSLERLVKPKA